MKVEDVSDLRRFLNIKSKLWGGCDLRGFKRKIKDWDVNLKRYLQGE